MDREELKELIREVYDDYDFAEFNIHFVNTVEPGKVYEIRNNRINNVLKNTTLIYASFMVSKYQMESMKLYDMNVKEHVVKRMIEDTADKILTDIYKVENKDWFHGRENVKIEMTIANWELYEDVVENGFVYGLRFEIA
jgi:regulator of PEP synthase PpsR (kinase-PPPase family)